MAKLQWYPGHMHKAARAMREILPGVDVVIELMDARIPWSSANPMLGEIRGEKPVIRVMTKADLADPSRTETWRGWYRDEYGDEPLAVTTEQPAQVRRLTGLCRGRFPDRPEPVVAMVAGIPNVGKSTVINILAGRSVAKTGNEPAVTRHQQRIAIGMDVVLLDTPGVLWPNVENRHSGLRLGATGSIRETALPHEEVARHLAGFLVTDYPELLTDRYGISLVDADGDVALQAVGRARGCLGRGGRVDTERAARILINDFRSGKIGRITLETPQMIAAELVVVAEEREQRAAKKAARKQRFKQS